MIPKLKNIIGIAIVSTLYGCASIPDATVKYYSPKSKVDVAVTQTVNCTEEEKPIVITNVKFTPIYSADLSKGHKINLSNIDTFYSSGDVELKLSQDGRIESFNGNSSGVGSDIVKTTISLLGLSSNFAEIEPKKIKDACVLINKKAGKDKEKQKSLSVVLRSEIYFTKTKGESDKFTNNYSTTPFKIDHYSQEVYSLIKPALGLLRYEISDSVKVDKPLVTTENNYRAITLVEPAAVTVKVIKTSLVSKEETEYSSSVLVPQWGERYIVPIPKPPLFGNNTMNLTLHESGRIKSIKYGSTNGAKDLGSALTSLNGKINETDEEKAKKLKAEADVIKEQQRLINCVKSPTDCK